MTQKGNLEIHFYKQIFGEAGDGSPASFFHRF